MNDFKELARKLVKDVTEAPDDDTIVAHIECADDMAIIEELCLMVKRLQGAVKAAHEVVASPHLDLPSDQPQVSEFYRRYRLCKDDVDGND